MCSYLTIGFVDLGQLFLILFSLMLYYVLFVTGLGLGHNQFGFFLFSLSSYRFVFDNLGMWVTVGAQFSLIWMFYDVLPKLVLRLEDNPIGVLSLFVFLYVNSDIWPSKLMVLNDL